MGSGSHLAFIEAYTGYHGEELPGDQELYYELSARCDPFPFRLFHKQLLRCLVGKKIQNSLHPFAPRRVLAADPVKASL